MALVLFLTNGHAQSFNLPVLISSTVLKNEADISIQFMKEAKYTPIYLGELRDTIFVDYGRFKYGAIPPPPPPLPLHLVEDFFGSDTVHQNIDKTKDVPIEQQIEQQIEPYGYYQQYKERTWLNFYDSKSRPPFLKDDIEIWVDDKTLLNYEEEIRYNDTIINGNGYPVYVFNKSTDSLQIGAGRHTSLILYAKNKHGNWQPIETIYTYGCGTGLNEIAIYPYEIALTMVPKFKGTYTTKMRLVMENYASNVFTGSINPAQFTRYTRGIEPPQISKWQLFKMRFVR